MIVMSGYAQEGSFTTTPLGGDVEILKKPFSPHILLTAVRRLFDRQ